MRRLLTTAALVASLPMASAAQDRASLWDLLSLDRFLQTYAQFSIAMLRTQMDLTYEDLSVDVRRSRVTMTGVKAWPFFDWDFNLECEIDIDRVTFLTTPIDTVERIEAKAQINGMTMTPSCLPDEAQEGLAIAGLTEISVPRLTLDIDYGWPKSDAMIRAYGDIDDVATIDLMADFSYFWFDGRSGIDRPEPVWFLRRATLAVENNGIWEAVSGELPPFISDPDGFAAIEGGLREVLMDMVREGDPDAAALIPEQEAFIDSLREAWPQFLESPEQLVLETGIDGDTYIDVFAIEDDPAELFVTLQPKISLAPARVSEALAADLLRRAMGTDAEGLSEEDRFRVGEALITGIGAPRNVSAGAEMLMPLAEAGNADAALLIAHSLATTDRNTAYTWALRAGKAGAAGATALLDTLERSLDFATVLRLQDQLSGADSHPGSALRTISGIREQASMRLSGNGLARSYGIAAMWAMLAKAAGDPEAADILQEIDDMVRLEGGEAATAWAEVEAEYSSLAMEVWIGQNLPARYAE
ncbi:MAG: hypothetical protein AAF626_17735 [Pseudomonadota bacterium]